MFNRDVLDVHIVERLRSYALEWIATLQSFFGKSNIDGDGGHTLRT